MITTPTYTFEEYLARERISPGKSEFYRSQIFAMAGVSPRHNTIGVNLVASLRGRLRGSPCRPFNSDQRIRIPANGLATYPDVSVVCGELQLDPADRDAVTNPRMIFEVLSKSTEGYDRGKKFDLYRQLASLQEYILVAQDEPQVDHYVRQEDGSWLLTVFKGMETILELQTLASGLPLSEIYEDVRFGAETANQGGNAMNHPVAILALFLAIAIIMVQSVAADDEIQDVTFHTPYASGRPTTADFFYNDGAVGNGRDGFKTIVDRVGKLPAGTSVVWGPNYDRCGSCSGSEPKCVPKFLYPDLWTELEQHVAKRELILSSSFPGPRQWSVGPEPLKVNSASLTIGWTNFHGPDTPHDDVLYTANGQYIGRGDKGFESLLTRIRLLPVETEITLPRYQYGGRWASESFSREELLARNAKLSQLVPFATQRRNFDSAVSQRKLKTVYSDISPGGETPNTVLDWGSGNGNSTFVSTGRIIRHDQQPLPPRTLPAARLAWVRFETREDEIREKSNRRSENEAVYTLNDVELGQGVNGFGKAMDSLAKLPAGSVVQVQVCLRTKGPFVCPITYKGHRHFERTGFEPCIGMFPWLIDVAKKGKLEIEWIPDEAKTCFNCELNR